MAALDALGRRLVGPARDDDRVLKVWDVDTGRELAELAGHREPIFLSALSADGRFAASASWNPKLPIGQGPAELKVLDVETGREVFSLEEPRSRPTSLALDATGVLFTCGSLKEQRSPEGKPIVEAVIQIWEAKTRRALHMMPCRAGASADWRSARTVGCWRRRRGAAASTSGR